MNVTLGVPRLKEIINASKLISTPIITARLQNDSDKIAARIVKASIEKTTLGEVCMCIKEVYSPSSTYISITLDTDTIEQLKLNVDAFSVRRSILKGITTSAATATTATSSSSSTTRNATLRALKEQHILIKRGSSAKLRVYVPRDLKTSLYFSMQLLKAALPGVIVQGIPSIQRAVINELTDKKTVSGKPTYNLLMEGYGLMEVMGSPGIDGLHTTTNHVLEVEHVLGVEAAR